MYFVAVLSALCFAVSTAQNLAVCSDLDNLTRNVNPTILNNCIRDDSCSEVICRVIGDTANFFTSFRISLSPCQMPPELMIQLIDGETIEEEAINPRRIEGYNSLYGTVVLEVMLGFTSTSVQVTINPFNYNALISFNSFSTYLINTTSLTIDLCGCGFVCCAESVSSRESGTTYEWPETSVGGVATFNCPLSPGFIVTRECGVGGQWQSFDRLGCGVVNEQLRSLEQLFSNLTRENHQQAISQLLDVIEQAENSTVEQNDEVLRRVALYFSQMSTFVKNTDVAVEPTVINDLLQIVESISRWQPENVKASNTSDIIKSLETVISVYVQQIPLNESKTFTTELLTLAAELRDIESLLEDGRSFSAGENKAFLDVDNYTTSSELPPGIDAAINLPSSLFELIEDRKNVSIFFVHYEKPTLFPLTVSPPNNADKNSTRETQVGSSVLGATVGQDIPFQDLDEDEANVTVLFQLKVPQGKFSADGSEKCVFWDFDQRNWSSKGCTTSINKEEKIVACSCTHLTNFAVLVDICLRQEDCLPVDPGFARALTFISYIGMSISISFLIITIFALICLKHLREKQPSIYHLQLSLAILFMLIVAFVLVLFSAGDLPAPLYEGCVTVSVLVHYFTLVAMMWMGAEALLMFQKLVIIFVRITKKFITILSIVCWGAPIVVVLIPLIIDLVNGNEIENDIVIQRVNGSAGMESEFSFCFLSHSGVFWGTFLAPIFAVIVFNLVVFVCVVVVLLRHKMGRVARKQEQMKAKTALRLMFSISCVMLLFGLTWLFAILTFSATGLRETFQLLFTVFNSLQGFFIFLFVLSPEIFACCGKMVSGESKTSQSRSQTATRKEDRSAHRKRLNTYSSALSGVHSSETLKTDRNTNANPQKGTEKGRNESLQLTYID